MTVDELVRFGGAQVVVIELVEWFATRGWFVDILTRLLGPRIEAELEGLSRAGRLTVHQDPNEWLDPARFDLVWITHSLFPLSFLDALGEGRRLPRILWSHMGSLEPLEAVNFLELEIGSATQILTVSPRTRERMVESGLPAERMLIFDNPVPASFTASAVGRSIVAFEELLVVSNHPPEEVLCMSQALTNVGINLRHIGEGGEFTGRVTPELLATADAVVTIGKTTQYCLAMGIPVYSYDHFGGAGWINSDTFGPESDHNFSGYRTQRKLTKEQIFEELWKGFVPTLAWATANRERFASQYSLDRQLMEVLENLGSPPPSGPVEDWGLDAAELSLRERWGCAS